MKLLIVLHHRFDLWNAPDWVAERLRAEFANLEVVYLKSFEGIESELADAEVLVTWSLRPEQVRVAQKLKWIHSPAAAVHGLMIPEVIDSDIVVTNASEVHGRVVAEHAMALLLASAKRLGRAFYYQRQRIWSQQKLWEEHPRPCELRGATLAIVGFGAIGREVARVAAAFGMRVLACREHPERESANAESVYGFDELPRMLGRADFVVLAAPLTVKTRECFDATMFGAMKPGAYFINVSRGALVNEEDMVGVLRAGKIGGAALDVFKEEPLSAESPLWEMPDVIITPHSAALTENLWERHYALIEENLRRYKSGEPLLGIVDKKRGY